MLFTETIQSSFSRLLNELTIVAPRRKAAATPKSPVAVSGVHYSVRRHAGHHLGILRLDSPLNSQNYLCLIKKAEELRHGGVTRFVIDLGDKQPSGLCALYALHALVCISQDRAYPDHELGTSGLHRLCEANQRAGRQHDVRLVCRSDNATQNRDPVFAIYPTVDAAILTT